ncbi:MAG: hypothetical protein Q4A58_00245 [Fusobacterium sp.]|uniref:hypothetical protein n=1 Tax=Fusobacterium sp. TaxID=68766 RepID=UPI0026DD158A|nr:hypothetical protein [Fusobacterium sp.]MDO4689717.1 hypothetical protein [Fusobacterium sp.]
MKKNEKLGLWTLVIWNLTIFGILTVLFIKLLLRFESKALVAQEEYIILAMIGIFIIVTIKPTFNNIKKLYLHYKVDINEEENKEIFIYDYAFMKMYQKLSLRRMFLSIMIPFLFVFTSIVIIYVSLFSSGAYSIREAFNFWEPAFSIIPKRTLILVIAGALFLFFKIYSGQKYKEKLLFKIYDTATEEEIKILDSIEEKKYSYVFTKEFLINWDGTLNIIPLKEIKEIKYVKYFYFLIYGIRLRIKANKKYIIWVHGPSEDEWIKRGFLSADKRTGKSVSMDINLFI